MVVAASMSVRDAATVMTERGFAALIVGSATVSVY